MSNVSVYNMEGNEVGSMELNDAVFGVEVNEHLVHMAVVQQLANNRQGTQKAKTRFKWACQIVCATTAFFLLPSSGRVLEILCLFYFLVHPFQNER